MNLSLSNKIITKNSLKGKLIDNLIEFLFSHNYFIFGGVVRDYIIPERKREPSDFDIGVENIENAIKKMVKGLSFSFIIKKESLEYKNKIVHSKLILNYKLRTDITFIIDISNKNIIGSNLDFDANGIYMTDKFTFKIMDKLIDHSLSNIIMNIKNKKFKVMKTFKLPEKNRFQMGIRNNSKDLLEYIKFMERTCKMLSRGWKLNKQKLEDIFNPCLIKKVLNKDSKCCICFDIFNKFEIELFCCKQLICFSCCFDHIKARFNNSEIACPFCRGDLFGWKTINLDGEIFPINDSINMLSSDILFGDIIPLIYNEIDIIN